MSAWFLVYDDHSVIASLLLTTHPHQNNSFLKMSANVKMQESRTFIHCWWEYKLVKPLWKPVQRLLKKTIIELPYEPANSWAYTQKNQSHHTVEMPIYPCSLWYNSQ
jgi:hypothetical protein